jgi:hypothetical protein
MKWCLPLAILSIALVTSAIVYVATLPYYSRSVVQVKLEDLRQIIARAIREKGYSTTIGVKAYSPDELAREVDAGTDVGNKTVERVIKTTIVRYGGTPPETSNLDVLAEALIKAVAHHIRNGGIAYIICDKLYMPEELAREIEAGTDVGKSKIEIAIRGTIDVYLGR